MPQLAPMKTGETSSMKPTRQCPSIKLSAQPLVLALFQVRMSPIGNLAKYIPMIQDAFRKKGYPLQREGKTVNLVFGPSGMQKSERDRWLFTNRDETRSVIVDSEQIVLQSTEYDSFEAFAEIAAESLRVVLTEAEHDQLGVIQRIGLRYVDVVKPRPESNETFRNYVQPALRGLDYDRFVEGTQRYGFEAAGRTQLSPGEQGTLIVRLHQNDKGNDLPPDLAADAPKRLKRAEEGELLTLIDIDHFWEGMLGPPIEVDQIVETAYRLHDDSILVLHKSVVTEEAVKIWK